MSVEVLIIMETVEVERTCLMVVFYSKSNRLLLFFNLLPPHYIQENLAFLGYYASYVGSFVSTFRYSILVLSSRTRLSMKTDSLQRRD
jgi:hypothetical protein